MREMIPDSVWFGLSAGFWFSLACMSWMEFWRWVKKPNAAKVYNDRLKERRSATAIEMVDLITEILDEEESRSLTIYSGNPDFNEHPSYVIQLEWIDWNSGELKERKRSWSGEHRIDILKSIKSDIARTFPVCYSAEDEDNLSDPVN